MPTIAIIEDEAARRIEALNASAFVQGTVTPTWKRSPLPLTASPLEGLRTHLSFSVSVEQATARDDAENRPGEAVTCVGELRVVFIYKIRPGAQADDYRLASDAAGDVLGMLLAFTGEWAVFPATVWKPGPIVNGEMDVELRFAIVFDLPISPSFAS